MVYPLGEHKVLKTLVFSGSVCAVRHRMFSGRACSFELVFSHHQITSRQDLFTKSFTPHSCQNDVWLVIGQVIFPNPEATHFTNAHKHTHTRTHAHTHTLLLSHTNAHLPTFSFSQTHTCILTYTHAHTHTRTHTHTHTHTHSAQLTCEMCIM